MIYLTHLVYIYSSSATGIALSSQVEGREKQRGWTFPGECGSPFTDREEILVISLAATFCAISSSGLRALLVTQIHS